MSQTPTPTRRTFDSTIVLANLTKLAGLGIALNELLIRPELRPGSLAISAFMMAGAQGFESFVRAFLGSQAPPPQPPPSGPSSTSPDQGVQQ